MRSGLSSEPLRAKYVCRQARKPRIRSYSEKGSPATVGPMWFVPLHQILVIIMILSIEFELISIYYST